jgi:hypothetical protein
MNPFRLFQAKRSLGRLFAKRTPRPIALPIILGNDK